MTVGLHCLTAAGYGWHRDELYYVVCSRHLDWGYVDLPPLTPLLLRLVTTLTGTSLGALRGLAALAAGGTVLVAGALVRTLGGGDRAMVVACLATMLAPILVGIFGIFTPNALDVLLWASALLVLARLLASADPREWLLLGALLGVAVENKHTALILALAMGGALLPGPGRRLLASPWPWAGATVAALLVAPHLAWQVANGWPVVEFTAGARQLKMTAAGPLAFLAEEALVVNPLALPLWIAGFVWLLRRPAWRTLGLTCLLALAITAAAGGKAYYLAGIHPALFAGGGVALEALGMPRLFGAAVGGVALGGLLLAPLAKPVLPPEATASWAGVVGVGPGTGTGERHGASALPQLMADQHGWRELAMAIAAVRDTLPPDERAHACIAAGNYGEAAAVDVFGAALGLPPAISGHNSYHLWGPRDCDFRTVIVVGLPKEALERAFASLTPVGHARCTWCMPYEADLTIWVAREPRLPPAEIWALARRYV